MYMANYSGGIENEDCVHKLVECANVNEEIWDSSIVHVDYGPSPNTEWRILCPKSRIEWL